MKNKSITYCDSYPKRMDCLAYEKNNSICKKCDHNKKLYENER